MQKLEKHETLNGQKENDSLNVVAGNERYTLTDKETIIPLEAKPVCPSETIKDPQTLNVANAGQNKRMRGQYKEIKTQATLFPANRYTPEESLLIKRLNEYDNTDRRFLLKGATWNMDDRKPQKHKVPVKDKDFNNEEGQLSPDGCYPKQWLRQKWGDFLYGLPWDWFVTITSKEPLHPETLDKLSNQLIHKLNRDIYGQTYYKKPNVGVLVAKAIEMQKRDVLHCHMLIAGVPTNFYRKEYWSWLWHKKGCVNKIEAYDKDRGAGYYLSKYVAKEANIEMYGNTSLSTDRFIPERLAGL
jgi:hypothetical protein